MFYPIRKWHMRQITWNSLDYKLRLWIATCEWMCPWEFKNCIYILVLWCYCNILYSQYLPLLVWYPREVVPKCQLMKNSYQTLHYTPPSFLFATGWLPAINLDLHPIRTEPICQTDPPSVPKPNRHLCCPNFEPGYEIWNLGDFLGMVPARICAVPVLTV